MLDKILIAAPNEAVLFFSNREPVTLRSGDQSIIPFLAWFFADTRKTNTEYEIALNAEKECTQPCITILNAA